MITRIEIEHFKSYRSASLPLAALTLLIGKNASGKSNAIEAMRFLSLLAQGRRLDDIFRAVEREASGIRGKMEGITLDGSKTFALGCELRSADPWTRFQVKLQREPAGLRIIDERIVGDHSSVPLYEIRHPAGAFSHEVQVAYNNFARGGRKPIIPCSDQQAILSQLETPSRFHAGPARENIPKIVDLYTRALKGIVFLDPNPQAMRDYASVVDATLRSDGANLSSVLYDLCEEQERKEEVLRFIRHLPEQDITGISFHRTPRNEVMVRLVETFAGSPGYRDAPVLSDGTLRVLSVAAALLSSIEGSLVVIEEIDNGVHPSRAHELLENIQRVAQLRGLRVLVTSHNPALMDTLPDSALPDVVCCFRDPDHGDSRLVRLQDLESYPELIAQGSLGQLTMQGVVDRFLKRRTDDTRQANGTKWLRRFKEATAQA